MTARTLILTTAFAIGILAAQTGTSFSFCGVMQESATARTASKAKRQASAKINREIYKLRRQHGRKLVVEAKSFACVGGGVAIDSNGNQITGRPSCTATAGFCVNP